MPNTQNIASVEDLTNRFSKAKGLYLTDFTGMTVLDAVQFREKLRENGVEFRVAKNTLIGIAAKNAGIEGLSDYLVSPTGIALSYDDPAAPAKIIQEFVKSTEALRVKVCWLDGEIIEGDRFDELASLPSKDELLAKLLNGLQHPMRTLAATLQASMTKFVGTLDALKNNKE